MSVELLNITKKIGGGPHLLFDNLNIRIGDGDRVGILGQPKSGKTTLLRIICGTELNYEGRVERTSTVSWPIPAGDFLVASTSVATNIRFIGRLYGHQNDDYVRHIGEMAGVTEFLNEELANCPRLVRMQLPFALGVGTEFDIYLFDEFIAAGDKAFKDKAAGIVKALPPCHGLVLATSNPKEISNYCDSVFVLDGGHATHFEDVDAGIKHFKSLAQPVTDEPTALRERDEPAPEDMESVLGI